MAEALEWPGRLARDHGWDYEVWTGADPVYLANVRFLAGYRRPWRCPPARRMRCWPRWEPGDTLAALAGRAGRITCRAASARRSCGCCGSGGLSLTFTAALDGDSVLEAAGG